MSIISIRSALQGGVNSITPALATAWENIHYPPVTDVPYQQVFILFATPDNNEYNGSHYRELGYMQINLMYPLKKGRADIDARAVLIRSTFARGNTFVHNGVTTVINRTPEIANGIVDGDRYKVIIKIPFYTNYS